jgi:hypothetical protein
MIVPEMIFADQQLEDIFSIVGTNLEAWLNILGLGQETLVRDDTSG